MSISLYYIDDGLKSANHVLAGITCGYLILPLIIYIYTFYNYCKYKKTTQNLGGALGDMMGKMTGTMGIQAFSLQNGCFRVLVYLNVFIGGALALYSVIVSVSYMSRYSQLNTVFGALVILELADIVLNFIEDRVILHYAKYYSGQFIPEIPFPPFSCCSCGVFS